jgi:hypothetical protein
MSPEEEDGSKTKPNAACAGSRSCVPRGRGWTRAPRGRGWMVTGCRQTQGMKTWAMWTRVDCVDSVDRGAGPTRDCADSAVGSGSCVPRGRGWTRAPRGRGWIVRADTGVCATQEKNAGKMPALRATESSPRGLLDFSAKNRERREHCCSRRLVSLRHAAPLTRDRALRGISPVHGKSMPEVIPAGYT